MKRIIPCLSLIMAVSFATAARGVDLQIDSITPNGDGSSTYVFSINSLPEFSFLDVTISGSLIQNPGGATYTALSTSPWKPAVVFTSDATLAGLVDIGFYDQTTDTVFDDALWPGKVQIDLNPANDGSNSVRVALASFTGGIGGPLPGGNIPLAQVTANGFFSIEGVLQSDSDPIGSFSFAAPGDRSWINPAGGAFETNANWDQPASPTAADNAIFDLNSAYTVTFAGDAETAAVSVFTDDVTFDLNTHTYTLSDVTALGETAGDVGRLTITDGTVEGRTVSIGREAGSQGSLTVSTGGTWNHPLSTMVAGRAGDGTLTVENGGTVNSVQGEVARDAGSAGLAEVSGATSAWTVSGPLFVGQGGTGDLEVSAGASVSADSLTAGEEATGLATIEVTGTGSTLAVTNRLAVGGDGSGTLRVLTGGTVTADTADAGFATGGTGTIIVSGTDSSLSAVDMLHIGRDGQGQLTISNGGTVTSLFKARLGTLENSSGNATITGTGSLLDVADFFSVGTGGTGNLTISSGGTVTDLVSIIGQNATATGTATVTGAGSTWTHTDRLEVGDFGDGTLDVTAGGVVSSANGLIGRRVGSTGDATISGAGSAWNMSGSLFVGGDIIGAGGDGQLTVSAGGKADVSDTVVVWQTGAIHLDGGEVEALTAVNHGTIDGSGLLDVNNVTSDGTISPGTSAGKITVDGSLTLTATSTVAIEINGSVAGTDYDVLEIIGAATLGGALNITVDPGFTPAEGEAFDVVTFASHSAQFDDITGWMLPDGRALISDYNSTELRLVASYFGDGNLDGVVDGLDYLLWAGEFGANPAADPPGAPQNGDYNNDGVVDGLDYLVWAGNFGQSISATAVPEPGTLGLFVLGLAAFVRRRR